MYEEIEKLGIKTAKWQNFMEAALPLDNPKVDIEFGDYHTAYFRISENEQPVAKFGLSFLHGCRGVLISHTMLVEEGYRNRGIAKRIRELEQKIAKDLKVTLILCTVRDDNKAYENVIKDWSRVGSFDNIRTGNKVNMFTVPVK